MVDLLTPVRGGKSISGTNRVLALPTPPLHHSPTTTLSTQYVRGARREEVIPTSRSDRRLSSSSLTDDRVCRSDLRTSPSSPSPWGRDEDNGERLGGLLSFDHEYVDKIRESATSKGPTVWDHEPGNRQNPPNQLDDTFDFRLFGSNGLAAKTLTGTDDAKNGLEGDSTIVKITLRSPTPPAKAGNGGFVIPSRPTSYYFTDGHDAQRSSFQNVALRGEDVRSKAKSSAWVSTTHLFELRVGGDLTGVPIEARNSSALACHSYSKHAEE